MCVSTSTRNNLETLAGLILQGNSLFSSIFWCSEKIVPARCPGIYRRMEDLLTKERTEEFVHWKLNLSLNQWLSSCFGLRYFIQCIIAQLHNQCKLLAKLLANHLIPHDYVVWQTKCNSIFCYHDNGRQEDCVPGHQVFTLVWLGWVNPWSVGRTNFVQCWNSANYILKLKSLLQSVCTVLYEQLLWLKDISFIAVKHFSITESKCPYLILGQRDSSGRIKRSLKSLVLLSMGGVTHLWVSVCDIPLGL